MHIFLYTLFLISIVPNEIDSLLASKLGIPNRCLITHQIQQPYFQYVNFYETDTGCVFKHPSEDIPFRFAVDSNFKVYSIFNQRENEYNDLLDNYCVYLTQDMIYPYGQFYLDVTQLYNQHDCGYYYLKNTNDFIKLNEQLKSDLGFPTNRDLNWDEIEKQIRQVCDTLNFESMSYNKITGEFTADYYIWMEATGNLRHIQVKVNTNGKSHVISDTLLVRNLGYYRYYHR